MHSHKEALDKQGIAYDLVDISTDPAARDYVIALGYLQAPVVVAGDQHWSGFRPDHIKALTTLTTLTNDAPFASDATAVTA